MTKRETVSKTVKVEWERSELFCPNCGSPGLWVMVLREGTYPAGCETCGESCEIDPWRLYEFPSSDSCEDQLERKSALADFKEQQSVQDAITKASRGRG